MSFAKKVRKQNRELIDYLRERLECAVCCAQPVDMDHLTSVGAGGDDVFENLAPTCRTHHQERHLKGLAHMIENYPNYRSHLRMIGRGALIDQVTRKKPK